MNTSPVGSVCGLAFRGLSVTIDGDCYPCCFAQDNFAEPYGNVGTDKAVAVWQEAMAGLRDAIATGEPPEACRRCPFAALHHVPTPDWWVPRPDEPDAEEVFLSPIGRIRLRTDWPALRVFLRHQLAQAPEVNEDREVLVDVHFGDPLTLEGDTEPEACPRLIGIEGCRFLLSRNSIVGVLSPASIALGYIRHWLWYALGTLCCPDGWEALHAAAMVKDGAATVIIGNSGSGKSTAALRLLADGYAHLADDLVLVSREWRVRGWGCTMNLRPEVAEEVHADTVALDWHGKCQWRPWRLAELGEYPLGRVLVQGEGRPSLTHTGHAFESPWRPQIGAEEVLFPTPAVHVTEEGPKGGLRVALVNRNPETMRWEGGDQTNLRGYLAGLRALGVSAEFVPSDAGGADGFDVVHSFHAQFPWARPPARWGKPLVVTAITHGTPKREDVEEVVRAAAVLACYSQEEAQFYRDLFPEDPPERFIVLPQGVPESIYAEHEAPERRDAVLMVGRYHPSKGQMQLLQACKRLVVPVTFVGMLDNPQARGYLRALREDTHGWPGARFFSMVPPDERLWWFYRTHKVHVNASAFEPYGLTTLEAMACGCNVVHTRRGWGAREFGGCGSLCEPDDVGSIMQGIMAQMGLPAGYHKRRPLTWEEASMPLVPLYEEVLSVGVG